MLRCLRNKRGSALSRVGPRFLIFVLVIGTAAVSMCQDRPLPISPSFSIGTDYFDLLRQRSDNTDLTIFTKKNFATAALRSDLDSAGFSFEEEKDYASYANRALRLNGSGEWGSERFGCFWERTGSFYRIGVSGTILSHQRSLFPGYSVAVSFSPFGPALECTGSWEAQPHILTAALAYQSDALPINEIYTSSVQSVSVIARPFEDLTGMIRVENLKGDHGNLASAFSFSSRDRSFGVTAGLECRASATSTLAVEHWVDEKRISGTLVDDGQSFGELSDLKISSQSWRLSFTSLVWNTPATFSYTYQRTTGSTAGNGQSWPFSDFVTSVVANRIVFESDGQYDIHTLSLAPEFEFHSAAVSFDASFLHIDTQASLTHWEPLFLVFGIQNYEADNLTLEWVRLARLGVSLTFPIFAAHVRLHFEQYVPLQLHYALQVSVGGSAPAQLSGPHNYSTDGGRRLGVTISL